MQTFDATWVRKYFSKGQIPQIMWTQRPPQLYDKDVNGQFFFWPDTVVLPDGVHVPRWRYFGALMCFNVIRAFQSKTPVLYYISWEQPRVEWTMDEYLMKYPNSPLPPQPILGYTIAEIDEYFNMQL